jgi:hypothetical protein
MRRMLIAIASVALLALSTHNVFACSCAGSSPPCQAYGEAAAVFVGTVIDSHNVTIKYGDIDEQMRSVRFSLDTAFRGVEAAQVEVLTGFGGGDCGFGFVQSQQYLVYAYEFQGKLSTNICTRTRSIAKAQEDLLYLRGLGRAKPTVAISGEVVRSSRDENGTLANQPLAGISIAIEGPVRKEVTTDAKGQYRVQNLPAGEYLVKASLPEGLATRGEPEKKVTIAERGCAVVSFWSESDGQLSGRVLNAQGLPVSKAEIFISRYDKERYQGFWDAAYSDEGGNYRFKLVPSGRYVLSIRFDGMTSQQRPFPLTYYPGVSDKSQATVITIKEGEHLDKYDLQMLPLPLEYVVEGVVVWSNGKPALGAGVNYLTDAVVYAVKVDEQGHFSFKAYDGITVMVFASVAQKNGTYIQSNRVQVVAGSGLEPVKLILPGTN